MKVLQINVRLTEGGAARVALEIHQGLLRNNIQSFFAYGYSKNIKDSPEHNLIKNIIRVGDRLNVLANFAVHKIYGAEIFDSIIYKDDLYKLIDSVDIVHLHALHTFFINYEVLVKYAFDKGKKIIWTTHDHWLLTGRCAFTEGCMEWMQHCGACPTLNNYPSALYDNSRFIERRKSALINYIKDGLIIVSPSKHLLNDMKIKFGDLNYRLIPNSIDREFEKEVISSSFNCTNVGRKSYIDIIVVANDLSYNGKTNQTLINEIAKINGVKIHLVGNNNPFIGDSFVYYGEVRDRKTLLKLYEKCDAFLFTSTVDNYPLVLCEALSAGLPVLATKSAAAEEIQSVVGGMCFSINDLLEKVNSGSFIDIYSNISNKNQLKNISLDNFGSKNMISRYISIYKELIKGVNALK